MEKHKKGNKSNNAAFSEKLSSDAKGVRVMDGQAVLLFLYGFAAGLVAALVVLYLSIER